MIRYALLLLVAMLILNPAVAQGSDPPEQAALRCLEEMLDSAAGSRENAMEAFEAYDARLSMLDEKALSKMQPGIDSIMGLCGFYPDGYFDPHPLIACMEDAGMQHETQDTSGSHYHLLQYLYDMVKHPDITREVNPQIILGALNQSIQPDDAPEPFYKLSTFIITQGVMHDFRKTIDNYEKGMNEASTDIEIQAPSGGDVIVIAYVNKEDVSDDVFFVVEKMAVFPGGDEALLKYLETEGKHPDESRKLTGKVFVMFRIDAEGRVQDPVVKKGLSPEYDKEAIRVIQAMPTWQPAEHLGKKVSVMLTRAVHFK